MLYFANPSTEPVREAMRRGELGAIVTPRQGNLAPVGAVWCADNGAFGKGFPGETAWYAWLCKLPYDRSLCAFAVAPDVVADATATLARSRPWLAKIRALGIPAAFVAQDGIESTALPWDEFDVLFIGGTTEFKVGETARAYAAEAVARGKTVHMGRVNSLLRLYIAASFGCASADGTFISFGPNRNLPRMQRWIAEVNQAQSAVTQP